MATSTLPAYGTTSRARLQALYADFAPQAQSSPPAFRANVEWWAATLRALVERRAQPGVPHGLVLRANAGLPDVLRHEGVGKPLALATVVAELRTSRALIPLAQFLSSTQSVYASGSTAAWLASALVGRPLWWALRQAGVVGDTAATWRAHAGEYVVLPLVEAAAQRVLEHQESRDVGDAADAVYSWDRFRREFGAVALPHGTPSPEDVKVLVKFLARDRQAVVANDQVIKFLTAASADREITPVDAGIAALKDGIAGLDAQIASLQAQADAHRASAAAAVRAKRPQALALSHLKGARRAEDVLRQRLGALDNLRDTLAAVDGAARDAGLVRTYASGAAALRAVLADPSLGRAHVEETMAALASANADAREIGDVLRTEGELNLADAGVIDDAEIEAELAQLAAETLGPRLPSAPAAIPHAKQAEEAQAASSPARTRVPEPAA